MCAADWWLSQLARADSVKLLDAVRAYARGGGDLLTDPVLHYRNHLELMDAVTRDWMLDLFEIALRQFNDSHSSNPEAEPGPLDTGRVSGRTCQSLTNGPSLRPVQEPR